MLRCGRFFLTEQTIERHESYRKGQLWLRIRYLRKRISPKDQVPLEMRGTHFDK